MKIAFNSDFELFSRNNFFSCCHWRIKSENERFFVSSKEQNCHIFMFNGGLSFRFFCKIAELSLDFSSYGRLDQKRMRLFSKHETKFNFRLIAVGRNAPLPNDSMPWPRLEPIPCRPFFYLFRLALNTYTKAKWFPYFILVDRWNPIFFSWLCWNSVTPIERINKS